MSRDVRLYLEDMRDACARVMRYTAGLDRTATFADTKTVDAVVRNLEVLGEAAKRVPDDLRARAPAIEWRKISGMRDVVAHEYFGVDEDILWDVIANKVPLLEELLATMPEPPTGGARRD